jgi:hypothetical protein
MESVLEAILINTYNQDAGLRAQAEEALKQFLRTSGSLVALVNFVGSNTHRELRLATCIVIKNNLRSYWSNDPAKTEFFVSVEEKEVVKARLVDILLVELDNAIRAILAESIRIVSETEFPDK